MIKNYLLIALVSLRKQPVLSLIKILSLTVGLAGATLVLMHVDYVQNSNKHIDNWQNTYRLVTHQVVQGTNEPYRTAHTAEPYAAQLRLDYPERIIHVAKIRPSNGIFSRNNEPSENSFSWAEPDAVQIFDLEFLDGDAVNALTRPNSMIINETTAEKYFPREDPVGQILTLDNQADIQVTGVFRDIPENSTHPFSILVSKSTGQQMFGDEFMNNRGWVSFQGSSTFLTLSPETSAAQINAELPGFIERNLSGGDIADAERLGFGLSLQSIDDIYLNPLSNFGSVESSTSKTVLYSLITFAFLILVTSCINYINLSLAQISQRTKEIGVRKALGANRGHIIWQFLIESLLLTSLAFMLALPLLSAAIPTYTSLTATGFVYDDIYQVNIILLLASLVILTGITAGILPAMSVSKLQAASVFSGSYSLSRTGKLIKAVITSVQFVVSATLILLAIAVYLQTDHMRTQDVAFEKDNLIVVDSRYNTSDPEAFNYAALRNELARHQAIAAVGMSSFSPPAQPGVTSWRTEGRAENDRLAVAFAFVDSHFMDALDLELVAGRGFSDAFPSDFLPVSGEPPDLENNYGVVITDLMARRFGFDSPQAAVGEILLLGTLRMQVIGVVRQFLLRGGIETDETSVSALLGSPNPQRYVLVRTNPSQTEAALQHIDNVWAQHRPDTPIDRVFLSQEFDGLIEARTNGISNAALFASIITIFIAACGLYALASYSSLRRTKEVGVRKVLGASTSSVVGLLAWDFLKPVLVACVVSWPIAYYFIGDFYADFSSQANFPIGMYLLVASGVAALAFATVSIQCYATSSSNPVEALRYE